MAIRQTKVGQGHLMSVYSGQQIHTQHSWYANVDINLAYLLMSHNRENLLIDL